MHKEFQICQGRKFLLVGKKVMLVVGQNEN